MSKHIKVNTLDFTEKVRVESDGSFAFTTNCANADVKGFKYDRDDDSVQIVIGSGDQDVAHWVFAEDAEELAAFFRGLAKFLRKNAS
jgi:hypothetical protein